MTCEDCYWEHKCENLNEVCDDFYSIYDEEVRAMEWSLDEWYEYISEYGDGDVDWSD